jgi:hypothetical protein
MLLFLRMDRFAYTVDSIKKCVMKGVDQFAHYMTWSTEAPSRLERLSRRLL